MSRCSLVLIVIACIGISTCVAFAEDNAENGATIYGEVIEANIDVKAERIPIEGATVKIISSDGKERTVKTDAKGKYKISGLPAGRYTIKVYKSGYGTRTGRSKVVSSGSELYYPAKMVNEIKRLKWLVEAFLEHVCVDIGTRYSLDRKVVVALYQSIQESIENVFKLDGSVPTYPRATDGYIALHEALLSHPDTKSAFAKHLTETQLQDYIDLTKARRQRDQLAVARQITVLLDHILSLTTGQRESIIQILLNTTANESWPISISILGIGSQELVNLVQNKLKISLDETLSPTQSKIWQSLVLHNEHKKILGESSKDGMPESQLWMQQLAEAKLVTHAEQLGPLDEDVAQRMAIVAQKIIQQYFETQNEDIDILLRKTEAELNQAVKVGEITREQAAGILKTMGEVSDIVDHPLYQQTIKDVLSEEVYGQYLERKAGTRVFRQQVARDMAVVIIDTQAFLSETQRKHLKEFVFQLNVTLPTKDIVLNMLDQFLIQLSNLEILSLWQHIQTQNFHFFVGTEFDIRLNRR